MRAFLAVLPPDSVVADLDAFLQPRREADTEHLWRWSRPEQLHLTLAFLADLPDWQEEPLVEALTGWAARHPALRMSLGTGGAFPDPAQAKVLWVGVPEEQARQDLTAWAGQLRQLANRHGGDVDGMRFSPHVTVARSGRRRTAGRWVQALDSYRSASFDVTHVHLVQSHLGEGPGRRPRYEVRASAELGPTPEGEPSR